MKGLFPAEKTQAQLCAQVDEKAAVAHSIVDGMAKQAQEHVNRCIGQQKRRMAERMGA